MDFHQLIVFVVIILLVVSLYKEWINPSLSFFGTVVVLLLSGVLTPNEALMGLANQQVAVIFLLMLITAGIRSIFGGEFFLKLFSDTLAPKKFMLRMMVSVSTLSAFLNNTPIVAFMIPYVKDWADRNNHPSSKFLIPLSFATIAGGMITVIGTSTNLILLGLINEYDQKSLQYSDFIYLGMIVTLFTWIYFYFFGFNLLPSNTPRIDNVKSHIKEYIVETVVFDGSPLVGKSIADAGLRKLKDLFLVEIIRGDRLISPVSPDETLKVNDYLFFSGNTKSIFNLINEDNGLKIPKEDRVESRGQFNFTEAVIPANSDLIGTRIKDSDFRKRYNASIVALHRNGKRVSGKVGEMTLSGGDFLLLLAGENPRGTIHERNLFLISKSLKLFTKRPWWITTIGIISFALLALGITGVIPLFTACLLILLAFVLSKVLNLVEIRRHLDLNLLLILVCSLAIGVALVKSGAGDSVASFMLTYIQDFGIISIIATLFIATTLLTALITNAAAVSIMFPIAMSLSHFSGVSSTPFFIAIAFAASGDFITPIGYQTNLMVYGPGGYSFKDFFKVGLPLTIIYMITCISFISWYYGL
ncbi:MAG: SLC13 family permease [Cyclobacteriaceae bacterium]|nr:SLC13 family permease [Cyclobacteriaceae bacterium]